MRKDQGPLRGYQRCSFRKQNGYKLLNSVSIVELKLKQQGPASHGGTLFIEEQLTFAADL